METRKMDKIYNYAIVEFGTKIQFCRAPYSYSIKSGDLVYIEGGSRKGKVLAVEIAMENNIMLNLLAKINYPEKEACDPENEAYKITAIYSKKEIEWKDEEND